MEASQTPGPTGPSEAHGATEPPPNGSKRPNVFRRLYAWVISWADRPQGPQALAVLSFAESSFFPIPPDPLLIALCLGKPEKALRFAAICSVASVLGGAAGYAIGAGMWAAVDQFFFTYVPGVSPESFAQVQGLYDRWDFWAVFVAGLTPIPYKVFTLSAGVFHISLPVFLLASAVSRSLRFFLLAGLIYRYGPGIQRFIDRYFDLLAWGFLVLIVAGFVLLEFVL